MTISRSRRWDWFEVAFEVGKAYAQVPGVQYQNGRFMFHRTHLPLLRGVQGLDVSQYLDDSQANKLSDRAHDILPAGIALRPWQAAALDWMTERRGVLIGDEMRLGKTLTALLSHKPERGPLVILAPLDTRAVWLRWVTLLWPGANVYAIEGHELDSDKLAGVDVIFGHFDILSHHQTTRLQPGTLIVDEAHVLSNPSSKRTAAVLFYASISKAVVCLTGTPLWNKVIGVWGILAACNPGAWGKLFDFSQRYGQPEMTEHGWKYNGVSNREEWEARRSEVLLARTWSEVLPDLPPINRWRPTIEIDHDDRFEVDLVAGQLMTGAKLLDVTVLARYRQAIGAFKARWAIEYAKTHDAPLVIWVWHKEVGRDIAKAIKAGGRDCFVMSGGENAVKRAKTIEAWNAHPNAVMVATMAVGQVGIDLSHALEAIFVEIDWTPAVLSQTEMRIFHPDRPIRLIYPTLDHEMDQKLLDTVLAKVARGRELGLPAAGSSFAEMATGSDYNERQVLTDLGELLLRGL